MILGDLGADVIMVEAPKNVTEVFPMLIDDTSYLYVGQTRNKRCIAVNLKKEEGKDLFYRLVEKADVLIEGNLPGVLKRRGLDYETLRGINQGLIYCSITGFGQDGPYAQRTGHEINFTALAGMLATGSGDSGAPAYSESPALAGSLGGTTQAVIAIVSALYSREKSGRGQYIDVSVTDGAVFYHWLHAPEYLLTGNLPESVASPTGSDMAWMNVYRARDGKHLAVGCTESWRWSALCKLLGRVDFVPHQFAAVEKQSEMYDGFSEAFLDKDRDEWVKILEEADVTASPVYGLDEVFADPHFRHRGMVVEVDHPKLGKTKLLNTPFKLSETPAEVRSRPPLWAEHTREVLGTLLGYSDDEIDRMMRDEVVE
jgi:crotonobetainyl-CoA:carnitine CoA-transferase CaiB-like acyl-CoA transferase